MRRHVATPPAVVSLVVLLCACSTSGTPTFFEGHVEGVLDGRTVSFGLHVDDDGTGGLAPDPDGFSATASNGWVSLDGVTGTPRVELVVPRFPIMSGAMQLPMRVHLGDGLDFSTGDGRSAAVAAFESGRWLGKTDERAATRGSWIADFYSPRGELHVSGARFQIVARCGAINTDPRVCGEDGPAVTPDRFKQSDCPPELTNPYLAAVVGDTAYECAGALCGSDVYGVEGGGCRWHRLALFGKTGADLTIAAWAEPECPATLRYCNAWR